MKIASYNGRKVTSMTNLMTFLIANEVGTSALLGTILDRKNEGPLFVEAREALASLLSQRIPQLHLTSPAPEYVELEHLNIDIVAVWSGRLFLIENKVAAGSVTRGQLNGYYQAALTQIERGGFLPKSGIDVANHPICFVYLTPSQGTGRVEFESLTLVPGRSDIKVHLAWEEVLKRLKPLCGRASGEDSWFFDSGLERIESVLTTARTTLPDSEVRSEIREFIEALKTGLQAEHALRGLVFGRWSDQSNEQLFASGSSRSAYVTLYISLTGTQLQPDGQIAAVGDLSFEVARKHRGRLKGYVASRSVPEWAEIMGASIASVQSDVENGKLTWRFQLPCMSRIELMAELTRRFILVSVSFKDVLAS